MAADPAVVEASKTLSTSIARVLIPGILIAGVIGIGIVYFRSKLDKLADKISERRKKKQNDANKHRNT